MTDIRNLHSLVLALKKAQRRGWVERGLGSDSIAEHSYGVIVVGWYLATKERVDVGRVVEMLLVHDLVMAKMEDVTPSGGNYDQKRDLEEDAKELIVNQIPNELQKRYLELFGEFNQGKTRESVVAREADKLETLLQGEDYEKVTKKEVINELLETYSLYFKTKTGRRIYEDIKSRRKKRQNG